MSDSVMLVCAVMAALAVGVLVAYGVCLTLFAAVRMHAAQTAVKRVEPAGVAATLVGN